MVGRCWSAAAGYLGVSMMFNDVFQGLGKSKSKGLLLPCCVSKSVFASLPWRSRSLSPALQRVCRNLLSCAFYSRWFEVLGSPESLPQLIPSWPWVALGLQWLQGAQAAAHTLLHGCWQAGPSAAGAILCWCSKTCFALHLASGSRLRLLLSNLPRRSFGGHSWDPPHWDLPAVPIPGGHRLHVLAGLEPPGVSCNCKYRQPRCQEIPRKFSD